METKSNGAWFPKDKGGEYLTYGPMGKSQMSMRKPIKLSTTFLVFFPIIYFCQNVVELVIAWKGKSMGNQIRIGQRPIFEKRVLTSLARKNAQKRRPFCHTSTFSIFQTILLHIGAFGEQLKSFLCVWISRFFSFLTFWEQLEIFLCLSFHDFGC